MEIQNNVYLLNAYKYMIKNLKVIFNFMKNNKTKYISKDVEILQTQLDNFFFNKKEPIVISLQGYWGIGKTYFWHNYIKHREQEDEHVYISLFGVNSLDDINRKIILKISDRAKISDKLQSFVGSSKVFGIDLSSAISVIDKKDFEDIIICFDDFERISPNLSISEVLGFISELKEQHKCKIVMINNNEILKEQDELYHQKIIRYGKENLNNDKKLLEDLEQKELMENIFGDDKKEKSKDSKQTNIRYILTSTNNYEIFEQFSEKIVDVKLRYEPSVDDLVNILKTDETKYIDFDFISKMFNTFENKNKKFNLRLMKQVVLKLEVIKDLLNSEEIEVSYKRGLIFNIARLVVKENIKSFKIRVSFGGLDASYTEYEKELFDLIYRHSFDIAKIKLILVEKSKQNKEWKAKTNLKEELNTKYFQYLYDMNYSDKEFSKEFFEMMENSEYDLVSLLSLGTFQWYIELLSKIDEVNKKKYEEFYEQKVKEYIEQNIDTLEKLDSFLANEFITTLNKNNELKKFYEEQKLQKQEEVVTSLTKEKIIKLIEDVRMNNTFFENEKILNGISYEQHKKWIITDSKYFENVLKLMKQLQGFSGNNPLQKFYDKTIEIYKKLYRKKQYKNKMEFVINHLNLKGLVNDK